MTRGGQILQGGQREGLEGAERLVRHSQDDARRGGIHAREMPGIEQRELGETDQRFLRRFLVCLRSRLVDRRIACDAAPVGAIIEARREE